MRLNNSPFLEYVEVSSVELYGEVRGSNEFLVTSINEAEFSIRASLRDGVKVFFAKWVRSVVMAP